MRRWALGLALPLFLSFSPAGRSADFNGDGTGDVVAFRPSTGLWSVQGITRMYLGSTGDIPVPGDYSGNGTDQAAIFRPSTGMWSIRNITRTYFGNSEDVAIAAGTVKAPERAIDPHSDDQAGGYYAPFTLSDADHDLDPDNIVRDITIFGVRGEFECN